MRVTTDFSANMKKDLSEGSLNDLMKVAGRELFANYAELLSIICNICDADVLWFLT